MDTYTWTEIQSQPQVWQTALEQLAAARPTLLDFYRQGRYERVIFSGCGSSYYLALAAAAAYIQITGNQALALPAAEIWLSLDALLPTSGRTLLVALSRSGRTSETLRAGRRFLDEGRGDLLTLTCTPESELASMGMLNLAFPYSQERSMVQTRSFSTVFLTALALAITWELKNSEKNRMDLWDGLLRLPVTARRLMDSYGEKLAEFGQNTSLEPVYFLGSGSRFGLAAELSLKLKEMSRTHCEPFHFLEFRHGPMAMVKQNTLLVGLVSQSNQAHEMAVLEEMQARGGRVLSLGEAGVGLPFDSGILEVLSSPLFLPMGQILAYHRARAKGLDPDQPQGLQAVIRLVE